MENLLDEIAELSYALKEKKEALKSIVDSIKKEMSDSYYKWEDKTKNTFRFALMLMFGEYSSKYDKYVVGMINISGSMTWETKKYENYYNIYKHYYKNDGYSTISNLAGFICFKKDLFYPLQNKKADLWKYQVNEEHYKGSLNEFTEACKNNEIDLFEIFQNYNCKKESTLTIVNYPSLKIKDVVVFIEK